MPYRPMTDEQVRAFLTALPPRTGKLATVRADGRPHVAPVWYDVDDDGSLVFNTGEATVKGRNLRRDPRASLCVDDERPPSASWWSRAWPRSATTSPRCGVGDADRRPLHGRRSGPRSTGPATASPASCVVRLRPERVVSALDLAD